MSTVPASDGRSTVYRLGDWAAVNNGRPYVDDAGCWWSVTREEGWSTAPAARASVQKWQGRDGQAASMLETEGRQIIVGGTIRSGDQLALHTAMDFVSSLLTGAARTGTLEVREPHVTRYADVRRTEGSTTEVAKQSPHTATFVLNLTADDPRRFGDDLSASTHLPSAVGGLTVPFTVPFAINSTVVSGTCSLTNPGTVTGPVRLRIEPLPGQTLTGPQVTHVGSGLTLVFAASLTLGPGEWIDVDMENQVVLANGQVSRAGAVNIPGFSGFEVGDNTWAFAAAGGQGLLTVTATPAW